MSDPCIDVAIIGIGPAGATLANLLGQLNVSVVVIEREAEIYPLPRAIHFDGEVMRVFETPDCCRRSKPFRAPASRVCTSTTRPARPCLSGPAPAC